MHLCFPPQILGGAISAVITYHNPENMPKDGICVANHTSPIDVLILACDNAYALVRGTTLLLRPSGGRVVVCACSTRVKWNFTSQITPFVPRYRLASATRASSGCSRRRCPSAPTTSGSSAQSPRTGRSSHRGRCSAGSIHRCAYYM